MMTIAPSSPRMHAIVKVIAPYTAECRAARLEIVCKMETVLFAYLEGVVRAALEPFTEC